MSDVIHRFLQLSREGATLEERREAFEDMAHAKIWPDGQTLCEFLLREAATTEWRLGRTNPAVGADTERMVQDALLTLYLNASRIDRSIVGWLRAVLMHLAMRDAKKHGPFNMAVALEDLDHHVVLVAEDDADHERQAELRKLVRQGINKLPKIYREAVRMYFLEGLGYEEISQKLKIRNGTARMRVCRACRALGVLLEHVVSAPRENRDVGAR